MRGFVTETKYLVVQGETIQLLGGAGVFQLDFFHFTSYLENFIFLTLCLKQNIYFSLCVEINIYFTFLEYFSVYKVGSQTRPIIVLEAKDPSEARIHKRYFTNN